jgi:Fungal chitosanase of glycosyl hydrolase group 75
MHIKSVAITIAALAACSSAFSIPENVQKFYNDHKVRVYKKPSFNPQLKGMEPLGVMAIVCGGQLVGAAVS